MDAPSLQENELIYSNCVFAIRNNKDFSCFKGKKFICDIKKKKCLL